MSSPIYYEYPDNDPPDEPIEFVDLTPYAWYCHYTDTQFPFVHLPFSSYPNTITSGTASPPCKVNFATYTAIMQRFVVGRLIQGMTSERWFTSDDPPAKAEDFAGAPQSMTYEAFQKPDAEYPQQGHWQRFGHLIEGGEFCDEHLDRKHVPYPEDSYNSDPVFTRIDIDGNQEKWQCYYERYYSVQDAFILVRRSVGVCAPVPPIALLLGGLVVSGLGALAGASAASAVNLLDAANGGIADKRRKRNEEKNA